MARKKVTSSDVAEKAGVSQATVSMVLNHKYNVSFSRETVEKVESAARELGYQLPGHKNKKENKKEKLIVVFCPTITSPYYVLLLQGIEAVANERGYGVFICNTQRDARLEEKYLRMIRAMAPQGIIYACNPHPDYISQVEEMARSIPLVIISNKEKISTVDAINQDNTEVGRLMARHLLDLGHRDVAFITPPLTRRQWQRSKRVDGFVQEFEKAGISVRTIRVKPYGGVKESLSLDTFDFIDLLEEEDWEHSDLFTYFDETRFLFVVFQQVDESMVLRGARFWSMPITDMEGPLHDVWDKTREVIAEGVELVPVRQKDGKIVVKNNLPGKQDNPVAHVRPHTGNSAYRFMDGSKIGDVERYASPLPDGRWMTKQSFWLNNDYVYSIVDLVGDNDSERG